MRFLLASLAAYSALTYWVATQVQATTLEWGCVLAHFAMAAIGNTVLLQVVERRGLALLASPAVAFLFTSQLYFSFAGLRYVAPIVLFPQFDLGPREQLIGSAAGQAVLIACSLLLGRVGAPDTRTVRDWVQAHAADIRRLVAVSVIGDVACKAALVALGYGSSYTDSAYTQVQVRSYGDFLLFLGSEMFGLASLLLGTVVLLGDARGRFGTPGMRVLALTGMLLELGYGLLFLKARAVLLVTAMSFAFGAEIRSRRLAIRLVQLLLVGLPAASLFGVQLTLLIGRVNVEQDAGLRLGLGLVSGRTDLTDFGTALLRTAGPQASDPAIVTAAVANAFPRVLFPAKQAFAIDVYSRILNGIGWPAGLGTEMVADYADSVFSAGVMAFGVAGWVVVPLALTWLYAALSRWTVRRLRGLALGASLLGLALTATHIETEFATILLNLRQALTIAMLLYGFSLVLRVLHQVVRVATLPPPRPAPRALPVA